MDGKHVRRSPATRVAATFVIALGWCAGGSTPALASAIHRDELVVNNVDSLGRAWARFLEGGTSLWATHAAPAFPRDLVLPKQDGLLVVTPFVQYLEWRRDLDPARFDRFHRVVGPELARLSSMPITSASTADPATTSPPPIHVPDPEQQTINTPEPGTLVITLVMIGASVGWARYRREAASLRSPG